MIGVDVFPMLVSQYQPSPVYGKIVHGLDQLIVLGFFNSQFWIVDQGLLFAFIDEDQTFKIYWVHHSGISFLICFENLIPGLVELI